MDVVQAIILGIVQGVTEFLPVSSSGHLAIVPWLFGWKDMGLTFDSALHLGTLFAILAYFWKDWVNLIKKWREPLLWLILIGCVPAGIAGVLFEQKFETIFRSPLIIALFMIVMGLVLLVAEVVGRRKREVKDLNIWDSLFIGFSQILALMPGVSRSGITMTAGLFAGFSRESAAKFSFLLATPIIGAAGLFKLRHALVHGLPQNETVAFFAGILASAIVGFVAIKFLLQYLKEHTFYLFVWYRLIAGLAIIIIWLLR